jgi:hypothetical protein
MIKPTVKRRTASHSNRKRTDSAAQRPTRKPVKRKPTRQATTDQRRRYSAEQEGQTESKKASIIAMLRAPSGATIEAMMRATGWQPHSVRGFLAGVIRKKLGLDLVSAAAESGRVYRIANRDQTDRARSVTQ